MLDEPSGPEWVATDEFRSIQEVVRAGLIGPRLAALIAYQKCACHMSCTSIEKLFGDVLHLDLSRGQLAKVVQKASAALAPRYEQLQAALPQQAVLNVEETDAVMQFCWAHLIRDVKFLATLLDPVTRRYGERLLATCLQQGRSAFPFIHQSIVACFAHQLFPSLPPQGA